MIDGLKDREIPGVTTEKTLAEYFANEYASRKGITFTITINQQIYELTAVSPYIQDFQGFFCVCGSGLHIYPSCLHSYCFFLAHSSTNASLAYAGEVLIFYSTHSKLAQSLLRSNSSAPFSQNRKRALHNGISWMLRRIKPRTGASSLCPFRSTTSMQSRNPL